MITQVGNNNTMGKEYQQYQKSDEVLFRTYSYKDGKGQEKVYYKKDCVEISLESYTVPPTADNYEEIKKMLKSMGSGKLGSPGNRFFSETYEIMTDYYNGDLSCEEVKNIFKEYVYHEFGKSEEADETQESGEVQKAKNADTSMSTYEKQRLTGWLAGLYEYFSRANTRVANLQNTNEGKALIESCGLRWSGTSYYNSDWYYACEEMQNLFRETANELADEYGAEHVDFAYVEQHTKFTLDGGITYNGVWDSAEWRFGSRFTGYGSFFDKSMVPPKDFVYCSNSYWDGESSLKELENSLKDKKSEKTDGSFLLYLFAAAKNEESKESLLLNQKHYSDWEENDACQEALAFLKNFNMHWSYRGNRFEFLTVG